MFRLLILFCVCSAAFGALPKGWQACKRSDPNYSKCLGKQIENAIKSLANGNKALGVMPLEPLRISNVEIGKSKGPVSIQLSIRDADIYGLTNIKVIDVKNDWKTMNVKIYLAPKLQTLCKYKGEGKILVLPLKGDGNGDITFENLTVNGEIKWKRVNKGGIEYFNMESINAPLEPEKVTIKLDNLFGEGAISDQVNEFLNQNWRLILDELRVPVSEALSATFKQVADKVLNKIPANEIDI